MKLVLETESNQIIEVNQLLFFLTGRISVSLLTEHCHLRHFGAQTDGVST